MVIATRHEIILIDAVNIKYLAIVPIVGLNNAPLSTFPLLEGAVTANRAQIIRIEPKFNTIDSIPMPLQSVN